MKKKPEKAIITLLFILLMGLNLSAQRKDYPIQPVAFTKVHVHDHFWQPKMEVNANVTIPYVIAQCRANGRMDNFLRAGKKLSGDRMSEFPFDDTDVYKAIEGASYAIQNKPNPKLEAYIDTLITIIGEAQEPDGYLFTFRTVNAKKPHEWIGAKRWEKEEILSHELYNAGHLYEAAVAHYQATGKKNFLNIAIKNADLLVKTFGKGKIAAYSGHQIVEIGLSKMYRITNNQKYLELAKFFLDIRGPKGDPYNQAHKKVIEQHEAVGHAVRAAYMYTGMADIAALTGDTQYLSAIDDIWGDVVNKKLYITGGIGATGAGEAFGEAYQLPNMSAYAETCAAIGNVYWNERMFLLHGDSKYIDVLEKTLYNGLLSGVSLSGDRFFYPNPLASMFQHQRSAWISCACCISNMARFLPSLPGYVYAQNKNELYVNLYMGNTSKIGLESTDVEVVQETDYPWKGNVDLTINPEKTADFTLRLRLPGWANREAAPGDLYSFLDKKDTPITIALNGKSITFIAEKGYAIISRKWKKGDRISLVLPMETNKVVANRNVKDDASRFVLQRGPIVYCLEGPDNRDSVVQNIMIDKNAVATTAYQANLLNGVDVISIPGQSTKRQLNSDRLLISNQNVNAIPYYAWANRGPSEMTVWIPYEQSAAKPKPAPTVASMSKVSSSVKNSRMFAAIKDQYEPADSKDTNYPYLHWWPAKNTKEFIQYDFASTQNVSESKIYWYDDSPWGGCRIPASYKLFYKNGDQWIPVEMISPLEISKDKFNIAKFKPVNTTALRMEIQLPAEHAAGVHEWAVK
ncbi:glycoside hydrolase family 127 protein [Pedobacter sp. MC2016-05]|uniref:glycoside hydrolase family 127 protein n=1 Tax=Pedobacter sp. MC2016-05 TaxID=2994474 RepID=UPI00224658F5|nr:glycoside hydrolase family 127 protein [Pedobacter sp. MC2016-05]MCX2476267.1 glycoside hydrolase family 127 protein [Pedobacter sp. MC2016-05]